MTICDWSTVTNACVIVVGIVVVIVVHGHIDHCSSAEFLVEPFGHAHVVQGLAQEDSPIDLVHRPRFLIFFVWLHQLDLMRLVGFVERHQSTSDKHDMLAVATVIGIGIVIAICRFWFWFDPLLHLGGMQMTFGLAVVAVIICQNVAISPQTAKIVAILPWTSKLLQSHRAWTAMIVDFLPQTDLDSTVRIHD
jgi:hypothetical protein